MQIQNTTGTYTFNGGPIGGANILSKSGAGTAVLNSACDKPINVTGGTLVIAAPSSKAITISGGTLRTWANDVLNDSAAITIAEGSALDLDGHNDTVGPLTLTGATVSTGSGTLTLAYSPSLLASATPTVFNGIINAGTQSRSISIPDGAASEDLVINAGLRGGSHSRDSRLEAPVRLS